MKIGIGAFSKKTNLGELEDDILIKKSKKGDSYYFQILLKRYKSYLYKIAYSYTKNEHDSLDLIQECSYKAWINIKKLEKNSSFKFWISKILINIAISTLNKKTAIDYIDPIIDIPEDVNDTIDERVDLQNAIDLLKPEYKTVIILKYFDDMTIQDISKIMDLSANTVKTYIRRAKECMKRTLKEGYLYEK